MEVAEALLLRSHLSAHSFSGGTGLRYPLPQKCVFLFAGKLRYTRVGGGKK